MQKKSCHRRATLRRYVRLSPFVATFTVSFTILRSCLTLAASCPKTTTCLWATTWIEGTTPSRPLHCSSATRCATRSVSQSYVETMRASRSRKSTVSMMSALESMEMPTCGSTSPHSSITCHSRLSLSPAFSVCMVASRQASTHSIKSNNSTGSWRYRTRDPFAISFGLTQMTGAAGASRQEAPATPSARTSPNSSTTRTI